MPCRRLWVAILVGLALGDGKGALAEPFGCPPGENCEISTAEKIRRSAQAAEFVARGSFGLTERGLDPLTRRSGTAFTELTFQVDEVLKGELSSKTFRMRVNIYTAPAPNPEQATCKPCSGKASKEDDAVVLSAELKRLERALEDGRLTMKQYRAKLTEAQSRILTAPTYRYNRLVLVPIHSGESARRVATVPLELGKQYVFMGFKRLLGAEVTTLFSNQLDLYPIEQLPAVRASLPPPPGKGCSR